MNNNYSEEKEFKYLFENIAYGIVYHSADGQIIRANKAAEKILGLSVDQMMGRTSMDPRWKSIKEDGRDFPGNEHPVAICLQTGEDVENVIMGVFHPKSNQHRWILIDAKARFIDSSEKIDGAFVTFRDITDLYISEEKIKKQEEFILSQSRNAAMGEMISMIAHQWRQPLGTISSISINLKMQSELANFDLEQKEEAKKYEAYINKGLDDIDELVQNLTVTIDDFRDFYKPNKESANIEIMKVVNKSLNIIKSSIISDNVNIIEEYNCKSKMYMYENEMMQVILNILKNAQDNFREKQIENPFIKIKTYEENDKLRLEICDNGGGIPEDIIEKIFDPYFSTKDEKNGTGLGLYMSKTIVEEHHNGKLSAKNIDDGVCFSIELGDIK